MLRKTKRPSKTAGVPFREMLRHVGMRKALAERVVVKNIRVGTSKTTGRPKAIAKTFSREGGARLHASWAQYTTFAEFLPKGCLCVSCSCPDFMYRWEWALAQRGASYITYSNGEVAGATNPRSLPGCCKHVIALMRAAQDRGVLDENFNLKG